MPRMKGLLLILLCLQFGCATKYIIPGNRFITPETHGGNLRTQIEIQNSTANQLTVKTGDDGGVNTIAVKRTGYQLETSLFERFDFYWAHTGGGNSLLGGKFQFVGTSRASGSGHKAAIAGGFGGNEHEIEGDPKIDFEMTGKEFLFLYGYRFNEFVMTYASLSHAVYNFSGSISSSNPVINGLEPDNTTKVVGIYGGVEIGFNNFLGKIECGRQELDTTATEKFTNILCGWSFGYHW